MLGKQLLNSEEIDCQKKISDRLVNLREEETMMRMEGIREVGGLIDGFEEGCLFGWKNFGGKILDNRFQIFKFSQIQSLQIGDIFREKHLSN